jgi:transposase
LLCHLALDVTANRTAQLTGVTRKTVTMIFLKICERIAEECERASPFSRCEVEVDESYFGARRVRGKRGRRASGKTIVFGIFKRNGCVDSEIVPDCKKATLQAIISRPRLPGSGHRLGRLVAASTGWSMSGTRSTSGSGLIPSSV